MNPYYVSTYATSVMMTTVMMMTMLKPTATKFDVCLFPPLCCIDVRAGAIKINSFFFFFARKSDFADCICASSATLDFVKSDNGKIGCVSFSLKRYAG